MSDFIQLIKDVLAIVGTIIGIAGAIYGIIQKRKLTEYKRQTETERTKTERTKQQYYRSKKKTEDVKRLNELREFAEKIWDRFTGKRSH